MKFSFNINITEKDYLDFNIFCMLNTPYGKKQIKQFRIINAVIIGLGIAACIFIGGFSPVTFCSTVFFLVFLAVAELSATKIMTASARSQVKLLRKSGKKLYSSSSVIEFYDESFTETDEEARTEQKYSSIDRISLVENRMIYIHINDIRAYLIPVSCFESPRQYAQFIAFIRTKCERFDIY